MSDAALVSVWELWGGRRSEMVDLVESSNPVGMERSLLLVSLGITGPWPHVLAFWSVADDRSLAVALDGSDHDGVDETRVVSVATRLMECASDRVELTSRAYLVERVRMRSDLEVQQRAADAVFVDVFARHQALLLWGASSFEECIERERAGWGTSGRIASERLAWWAMPPPRDRSTVPTVWAADPTPVWPEPLLANGRT